MSTTQETDAASYNGKSDGNEGSNNDKYNPIQVGCCGRVSMVYIFT
jgi:hypothetical protein